MIPKNATLWIPLGTDTAAKLDITIEERGLGAMDPNIQRQPTLHEMEAITETLTKRGWTFNKPV